MIKPLDKYVLVTKKEPISSFGIYLPQNDSNVFTVIKVGINVIEVKENDNVIIDKSKTKEITYENVVYYLIKEEDILGIVED